MVYSMIKGGYNQVLVIGDTEKVRVINVRSSTETTRVIISKNPGIIEKISQGLPLFVSFNTEDQFRNRIKKAIKKALDAAHSQDLKDATDEAYAAYMKSYGERQNTDLGDFVNSLKEES